MKKAIALISALLFLGNFSFASLDNCVDDEAVSAEVTDQTATDGTDTALSTITEDTGEEETLADFEEDEDILVIE